MDVYKEIEDELKRRDASLDSLDTMHWLPRWLAIGSGLLGLATLYYLFNGKWGAMVLAGISSVLLMYSSYRSHQLVTLRRISKPVRRAGFQPDCDSR